MTRRVVALLIWAYVIAVLVVVLLALSLLR